jgi:hypothetical protein
MENNVYLYGYFMNKYANISTRNRAEMYALAYSFRQEKLLILIHFILSSISALTLFMLFKIYKCAEIRRIFSIVDLGLKIPLFFGLFAYIIGALNSMLFFGYQFSILLFDFGPLFYIWSGDACFWTQIVFMLTCSFIVFFVFFATFLERLYVSIGFRSNGKLGCLLIVLICTLTAIIHINIYNPTKYENERVYCDNPLSADDVNLMFMLRGVILADFMISLMDFGLLLFNKRRIRAYK